MKVLLLSLDKTLLGEQIKGKFGVQGDTIARHRKYGELVEKLNIVVTSPQGFSHTQLADNIDVYPTNGRFPWSHFSSVLGYAESFMEHGGLDLVVSQDITSPAALKIKKKYGVPYIVTFHAAGLDAPEMKKGLKERFALPFVRRAIKHADGLRVVSREMKKHFEYHGFKGPIEVIPTASDHTIFSRDNIDQLAPLQKKYAGRRIILANGRLAKVKNYPLLFGALQKIVKEYDDVLLLIIGSGDLESDLKKQVHKKKLDDHVEFLGSVPYEDMVPYFQICDVFALTSDSESLGKVLLQAGAAKKPVVTTATLGAKSIVLDGKTGYLVKPKDTKELTTRLLELLGDVTLRERLGTAAHKHVMREYDTQMNIKKFVTFWREVAKHGP